MGKKTPNKTTLAEKIVYVTGASGDQHSVRFNDPNRVHPALKSHFGYCMFKVANRIRTMLDSALAPLKLQSIHLGILSILDQGDMISQIQMGEEMGIDKASMVKLIDKLELSKLVERMGDPKDRRIKLLRITASGRSTFTKGKKIACGVENELLKNLEAKDQELLKKLLPQLLTKD